MAQKKHTTVIYKHTQLLERLSATEPAIPGFSVRLDRLVQEDIELFKSSFRSDFFTVLLITEGQLHASINLEEITAAAGSLVILAPDATKKVNRAEDGTRISVVSFTLDFLAAIGLLKSKAGLLDCFSMQLIPYWQLAPDDVSVMAKVIQELHSRSNGLHEHPHGTQLLYHTFYIFLYEMAALSKKYAEPMNLHRSRKESLIVRFTELVREQFRSQRNLETYARALNITAKHLTATTKEITGKTAGEIIDDFVLLEAKLLLNNSELSIAQVANELNFSDQSFFGKFFKRHTGLSPKQYRQSLSADT